MAARSKTDPRLPPGLSPSEESRWWDEHREYWDTAETRDELVGPSPVRPTKPVNLRLPVDMIDELKREAARRALPYQTLIQMWLREKVDARTLERNS